MPALFILTTEEIHNGPASHSNSHEYYYHCPCHGTLWALAFVRLVFGFRTIVDTKNGIKVPWIQIGWVVFAWAFLFVSYWPVIDVMLQEDWVFSDLLLMVIAGLLLFLISAAIAPDGTYKDADGESRYLEVAPLFFGLFAAYQAWLIVLDNALFRRRRCGAHRLEHWDDYPGYSPGAF